MMVGPCGCRLCCVLASWVRYLLGSSAGQVALSRYWHRRGILWVPPTCQAQLCLQSWLIAGSIKLIPSNSQCAQRFFCANLDRQHVSTSNMPTNLSGDVAAFCGSCCVTASTCIAHSVVRGCAIWCPSLILTACRKFCAMVVVSESVHPRGLNFLNQRKVVILRKSKVCPSIR